MTQEELDALMAGGLDDEIVMDETVEEKLTKEEHNGNLEEPVQEQKTSADMAWPPPEPTNEHKMVYQLDDVTKDSELKAGEVFDKLESINEFMATAQTKAAEVIALVDSNIELFTTLCEKFPNIEEFSKSLDDNQNMKTKVEELIQGAQDTEDEVMMAMDIMQYQDIHRQKIERVINVMRALSSYMSSLFEGKIDDSKRVSSAVHIEGDKDTEDVVSNDDIEALIANLGKS